MPQDATSMGGGGEEQREMSGEGRLGNIWGFLSPASPHAKLGSLLSCTLLPVPTPVPPFDWIASGSLCGTSASRYRYSREHAVSSHNAVASFCNP